MKARTVSLIAFYGLVAVVLSVGCAAWLVVTGHPFYGACLLALMVGIGHWMVSRDYAKKSD